MTSLDKAARARRRKERFLERQRLFAPFPVELRISKSAGRGVFAAADLPAGTTVLREAATAYVVRDEFSRDYCQVCLSDLRETVAESLVCGACKARHCSEECARQDRFHAQECPLVAGRVLVDVALDSDMALDLVRLVARLVFARHLEETSEARTGLVPTPFRLVDDVVAHERMASEEWLNAVTKGSELLLERLPAHLTEGLETSDLVGLACRINANAHALGDPEGALNALIVNLFPLGCIFNHSCAPNTVYVAGPQREAGGEVLFRTVRDVQHGEELCVSYINLVQPREARQADLLASKSFLCECERCSAPRGSEWWRRDLDIEGMRCGCGAIYEPSEDVGLDFDRASPDSILSCPSCPSTVTISDYRAFAKRLSDDYDRAVELFEGGRHQFARTALTQLLERHAARASHAHHLIYSTLHKLAVAHSHTDLNFADALRYLRSAVERLKSSNVLPAAWPDMIGLLVQLAQFGEMEAELVSAREGHDAAALMEEAVEAWERAIDISTIVFGRDHPRTLAIAREAHCQLPHCSKR
ncbi:hypothetical protein DFJ74DRAFT_675567 [Hyaloraphidium curvatum]|nr:hypothetical protein DFJ74DRAFT_675567 [Hyaloraphidium curvatum]